MVKSGCLTQIRAEMAKPTFDQTFTNPPGRQTRLLLARTRPGHRSAGGSRVTRVELARHHALAWRSAGDGMQMSAEREKRGGGAAL